MARRVDIVSDTHGYLSPELLRTIDGCDMLIHAGDITSESDFAELEVSVPCLRAVLGNNDGYFDYGPDVRRVSEFVFEGLRFAVAHYAEDLPLASAHRARAGVPGGEPRVRFAASGTARGFHRTSYGRGRLRALGGNR